MSQKPSIPKGTRDFGPQTMAKRNYILETIKSVFKTFGFMPLETPSMENLAVLTGKYGEEGDQLIFKILNSGDFLAKVNSTDLEQGAKPFSFKISEKALRYDLTVPFARYVVMNQNEIALPFKRFQIQPVWRADRPQKGRYREFFQCDADVVGTDSLLCEAEIILMINEVFDQLGITDFTIKVNNRKILSSLAKLLNAADKETALFVAIDKLDKIGLDKVIEELATNGFETEALEKLREILSLQGSNETILSTLNNLLGEEETGQLGISELKEIQQLVAHYGLEKTNMQIDVTLARGLSYYTGSIFEVKVNNVQIGSVSGGGRYDDLTGLFGMKGLSGVGFSFGVDRLYDVLNELNLFPDHNNVFTHVLICNFDEASQNYTLPMLTSLRKEGIHSEIYPSAAKLKKQMNYANKKNIPFVILAGSEEVESNTVTIKNMESGDQQRLPTSEAINYIVNALH